MTRAPSVSSRPGRSATSRLQVTGTDRSAAGSRRVRNTVAAPRRDSWAICPSTHTSPSRPIHSATLRATVRTGQGASGDDGAVMSPRVADGANTPCGPSRDLPPAGSRRELVRGEQGVLLRRGLPSEAAGGQGAGLDRLPLELLQAVAQHPQVWLAAAGRLLVGHQVLHGGQLVAAQASAQLGDREV